MNASDDMPEWLRRTLDKAFGVERSPVPDEPFPNVTDTQKRCAICGCFVLDPDAETCMLHRKFEHLKLLVQTGEVSDWPAKYDWCGTLTKRHLAGMYSTCRVHWSASVKAAIAFYNGLNHTNYRFV